MGAGLCLPRGLWVSVAWGAVPDMMGIGCVRSNTQGVFVRSSTLTIEELEQSSGRVAAAESGPVYITEHGRPIYVLLSFVHYQNLISPQPGIVELLAGPGTEDIEFEVPRSVLPP